MKWLLIIVFVAGVALLALGYFIGRPRPALETAESADESMGGRIVGFVFAALGAVALLVDFLLLCGWEAVRLITS